MTAPPTRDDVVMVDPWALVVVTGTSTLAVADDSRAEDDVTETLPSDSVLETAVGTSTPDVLCVAAVLTTVLPWASVVVTELADVAGSSEETTVDETVELPWLSVVLMGAVVAGIEVALTEVSIDSDCELGPEDIEDPGTEVEPGVEEEAEDPPSDEVGWEARLVVGSPEAEEVGKEVG